jgi:anti-anti-sigma factor
LLPVQRGCTSRRHHHHHHRPSRLSGAIARLATAGNQSQGHLIAEPSISYSSLPTSGGPDEEACCFSSTRPVCSTRGYCAAMAVTPPDHLDDASDVDLDVQRSWVGNVIVLTVRGDLDALSAPHLAAAINRGLSGESSAVVVDLSELEFLALSGMSVFIDGSHSRGQFKAVCCRR